MARAPTLSRERAAPMVILRSIRPHPVREKSGGRAGRDRRAPLDDEHAELRSIDRPVLTRRSSPPSRTPVTSTSRTAARWKVAVPKASRSATCSRPS